MAWLYSVVIPIVFLCLVALSFIIYWCSQNNSKRAPRLYFKETHLSRYLIQKIPRLTSPFHPTIWLQNAHIHTILASFLPSTKVSFKRGYLELEDKGVLALDWVTESRAKPLSDSSPVLIALPGLTGDATSVSNLCALASDRGYRVVVFNKRGHGDSVLLTPKLQGFGDTSDFNKVVSYLEDKYPLAKLVAVGSSAGSGLLVSFLGEYGQSARLAAGVCISPGYDAIDLFLKTLPRLYEILLLFNLKRLLRKHAKVLSQDIDVKAALSTWTFGEFDTHVYCKFYGYKDILEYWKNNNPMRNITNVSVPVLSLSSLDDPVCRREIIPFGLFEQHPDCMLVTTDKGGHCGFMEGWRPESWSDKLALDYVDAVLQYKAEEVGDSFSSSETTI